MQRVLVVDDDPSTADTLGLIFRKKGFEICVAYNTDDALKCLLDLCPDLVLCDITMPGRDGLELLSEIARLNLRCSVLVLTGYLSNLKPVRDRTRGMSQRTDVLTKPCPPDDVLRAARSLLSGQG